MPASQMTNVATSSAGPIICNARVRAGNYILHFTNYLRLLAGTVRSIVTKRF